MKFYDEQLQKLQEQIARKRQLEAQVSELRTQRSTLSTRVRELEAIKMQEQADVDKLEGRSLAAFFYNVIGKMDEQLNKEREEAYAARVKYDAAARELTAVEDELARYEAELSSLRDCERQYDAVLQEKAGAVKAAGGPAAEEILKLEERLAFLESQKRELREAVSAGNSALSTANHVLSSLDSAEGWGTWDLFGGGLISDLAKHSHLDEAQGNIEHLQSQLRRFKTELADVRISADMQVNVDGFLRFADYFFDGLFADWAVLDRINQSQEQVHSTKRQIENVLSRLNGMQRSVEQEQNQLESKLDIHKAMKYAVKHDLIIANPMNKVERPKGQKYTGSFYSISELEELFDAIKGDPCEFPVLMAAFYGLRRSEIMGLRWQAIDFENNQITIDHTVVQCVCDGVAMTVEKDRTKNKSSCRSMPLVPQYRELLLSMKERQENCRKLCGNCYTESDYIFVNDLGVPYKPNYVTQHFKLVLQKHELRDIRFHDLRHTCASLLLKNGVPMKDIQEWLGHSDYNTTANIYAHLDTTSKSTSATRMTSVVSINPSICVNV